MFQGWVELAFTKEKYKMEIQSFNPFSGDDDLRRQILEKEGRLGYQEPAEFQDPSDQTQDLRRIITNTPSVPKSVSRVIQDASSLAATKRDEKSQELTLALSDMMTDLNKQYGLSLDGIDLNNFSHTLSNVADPRKRRVLELYLSEISQSIRPVLYLHILQRLMLVIDQVLRPENLLSNEWSSADKVLLIEKLIQEAQAVGDLVDSIKIENSDKILEKISSETNQGDLNSEENREIVQQFLDMFKKENLDKNK